MQVMFGMRGSAVGYGIHGMFGIGNSPKRLVEWNFFFFSFI